MLFLADIERKSSLNYCMQEDLDQLEVGAPAKKAAIVPNRPGKRVGSLLPRLGPLHPYSVFTN